MLPTRTFYQTSANVSQKVLGSYTHHRYHLIQHCSFSFEAAVPMSRIQTKERNHSSPKPEISHRATSANGYRTLPISTRSETCSPQSTMAAIARRQMPLRLPTLPQSYHTVQRRCIAAPEWLSRGARTPQLPLLQERGFKSSAACKQMRSSPHTHIFL